MSWLIAVLAFAAFVLVRWTRPTQIPSRSVEGATDLLSWYRGWSRDSTNQPATADELRHMLETYRRGRHTAPRFSSLPETQREILALRKR